ncbi:MAG: hypothetical protein KDA61_12645, partial [Planctomycetales bacterium]|nr:hypothetical protein [Planctomycetales bacterium]
MTERNRTHVGVEDAALKASAKLEELRARSGSALSSQLTRLEHLEGELSRRVAELTAEFDSRSAAAEADHAAQRDALAAEVQDLQERLHQAEASGQSQVGDLEQQLASARQELEQLRDELASRNDAASHDSEETARLQRELNDAVENNAALQA